MGGTRRNDSPRRGSTHRLWLYGLPVRVSPLLLPNPAFAEISSHVICKLLDAIVPHVRRGWLGRRGAIIFTPFLPAGPRPRSGVS